MSSRQTKKRIALRTTQIATVFRTIKSNRSSVYLTLGLFTPFLHLFAGPGQEGPLHWKWMASFLNSIGWALSLFFIGLSILTASTSRSDRRIRTIKGLSLVAVGMFYMSYSLLPIRDFSSQTYYIMLIAVSLASTCLIYMAHLLVVTKTERLKQVIRWMFDFILSEVPHRYLDANQTSRYKKDCSNLIKKVSDEL